MLTPSWTVHWLYGNHPPGIARLRSTRDTARPCLLVSRLPISWNYLCKSGRISCAFCCVGRRFCRPLSSKLSQFWGHILSEVWLDVFCPVYRPRIRPHHRGNFNHFLQRKSTLHNFPGTSTLSLIVNGIHPTDHVIGRAVHMLCSGHCFALYSGFRLRHRLHLRNSSFVTPPRYFFFVLSSSSSSSFLHVCLL